MRPCSRLWSGKSKCATTPVSYVNWAPTRRRLKPWSSNCWRRHCRPYLPRTERVLKPRPAPRDDHGSLAEYSAYGYARRRKRNIQLAKSNRARHQGRRPRNSSTDLGGHRLKRKTREADLPNTRQNSRGKDLRAGCAPDAGMGSGLQTRLYVTRVRG